MSDEKKNEDIGEQIKRIRQSLNMTQCQLANVLGVSSNYLSMLERGERNPSLHLMEKMTDLAGISIDELLNGHSIHEATNLELYLALSKNYQPKEVADALLYAKTYLETAKR